MQTDLIIIREYCRNSDIEPSFINLLKESGLIDISEIEEEQYILSSQLSDIEKYARLHYDLSINIEGIEAIRHLLDRIDELQQEIRELRSRIRLFSEDL